MRLPNISSESESDDEFPETKPDSCSDEERDSVSRPYALSFRSLRQGIRLDVQDDDGIWYAAEIKKIDRRGLRVYVSYLNSTETWDHWVPLDHRVTKVHTYSYDNCGNFKIGQIIEYNTGMGLWHRGTIVSLLSETNRIQICSHETSELIWIHSPRTNIRSIQRNSRIIRNARRWKVPHTMNPATVNHNMNMSPSVSGGERNISNEINSVNNNDMIVNSIVLDDTTHTRRIEETSDKYNQYIKALQKQGLYVVPVNGDGNCLFRAVAHQIYGNENLHNLIRESCMQYMEIDAAFFSQFVEGGIEAFPVYLTAKRMNGCWGDDPEVQALCEIYDRPAEIYAYDPVIGARKLRTFHEAANMTSTRTQASSSTTNTTYSKIRAFIKLSYYGGGHYDSIIGADYQQTLVKLKPGVLEMKAIDRCKQRQMHKSSTTTTTATSPVHLAVGTDTAISGNSHTTLSSKDISSPRSNPIISSQEDIYHQHLQEATKISDTEATEREALDRAIQISRHDHLGWVTAEDMDTFLSLALEQPHPASSSTATTTTTTTTDVINSTAIDRAHSIGVSSLDTPIPNTIIPSPNMEKKEVSVTSLPSEVLYDVTSDLMAVHQDDIQMATIQSEQEFLDQAILNSIVSENKPRIEDITGDGDKNQIELSNVADMTYTDDLLLEQARLASLQEFQQQQQHHSSSRMNEKIEGADDMSRTEKELLLPASSDVSAAEEQIPDDMAQILQLSEMSDEELMRLAIQESMKSTHYPSSFISHPSSSNSYPSSSSSKSSSNILKQEHSGTTTTILSQPSEHVEKSNTSTNHQSKDIIISKECIKKPLSTSLPPPLSSLLYDLKSPVKDFTPIVLTNENNQTNLSKDMYMGVEEDIEDDEEAMLQAAIQSSLESLHSSPLDNSCIIEPQDKGSIALSTAESTDIDLKAFSTSSPPPAQPQPLNQNDITNTVKEFGRTNSLQLQEAFDRKIALKVAVSDKKKSSSSKMKNNSTILPLIHTKRVTSPTIIGVDSSQSDTKSILNTDHIGMKGGLKALASKEETIEDSVDYSKKTMSKSSNIDTSTVLLPSLVTGASTGTMNVHVPEACIYEIDFDEDDMNKAVANSLKEMQ